MTNKELVAAFFEEGYVKQNYDYLMKIMAADYFDHSPAGARTNQDCVDVLKGTAQSLSGMQVEVLDLIEEDSKVTVRAQFTARHTGQMMGFAPTGRVISFEALEIFKVENGLITESWGYWPDLYIKKCLEGVDSWKNADLHA